MHKPHPERQFQTIDSFQFEYSIEGGYTAIEVKGYLAYLGQGSGLSVVDVQNERTPTLIGRLPLQGVMINSISVVGNYAYAAHTMGLAIINISSPTQPQLVKNLVLGKSAMDVELLGSFAFLALPGVGVIKLDISDPANPQQVANRNLLKSDAIEIGNNSILVHAEQIHLLEPNSLATLSELPIHNAISSYTGNMGNTTE